MASRRLGEHRRLTLLNLCGLQLRALTRSAILQRFCALAPINQGDVRKS